LQQPADGGGEPTLCEQTEIDRLNSSRNLRWAWSCGGGR
jgi:hypothetical protein